MTEVTVENGTHQPYKLDAVDTGCLELWSLAIFQDMVFLRTGIAIMTMASPKDTDPVEQALTP